MENQEKLSSIASDVTGFFQDFALKNPSQAENARKCIEILNDEKDGYVAARKHLTKLRQSRGKSGPRSVPTEKQIENAEQALLMVKALSPMEQEQLLRDNPREIQRVLERDSNDYKALAQELLQAIGMVQERKAGPRLVQYKGRAPEASGGAKEVRPVLTGHEMRAHALIRDSGLRDVIKRIYEDEDMTSEQAFELLQDFLRKPTTVNNEPTYDNSKSAAIAMHVIHAIQSPPALENVDEIEVVTEKGANDDSDLDLPIEEFQFP